MKRYIHFFIILSFIIYLIFSNFLFDNLLTVEGESKIIQKLDLPEDKNNITYGIDKLEVVKKRWKELIRIKGWAFVNGQNANNNNTYIALISQDESYVFNTIKDNRPDIAEVLEEDLDIEKSGFQAFISRSGIKDGQYRVGIYIDNEGIREFTLTNSYFTKHKNDLFGGIVANSQTVDLPNDGKEIKSNIEIIQKKLHLDAEFLELHGWAFVEGQSTDEDNAFVVLKSIDRTYVFDTVVSNRPDVTNVYKNEYNTNLDNAGFQAFIPSKLVENGRYNIGICIKNNIGTYLTFSNDYIIKKDNDFLINDTSSLQQLKLPAQTTPIKIGIDIIRELSVNNKELLQIHGWAFIENLSSEDNQVYVVLQSEFNRYAYDTKVQHRPDVTSYFENLKLNLDDSGFLANIPRDELETGIYNIGIYIENEDIKGLQFSDKYIEVNGE